MADPVLNAEHVSGALARLLWQFRGQPHLSGIFESYLVQAQELETVFIALMIERYVKNAVGVQLDGIGDTVGEPRLGRVDIDYRVAITGRITRNRASSRIEDILRLFAVLLPNHTFALAEGEEASFEIAINEALGPEDGSPEVINSQLQEARGGGINAHLIHSAFDASVGFTFSETSAYVGTDPDRGFSNVAESTGGRFAGTL